MRNVLWNLQHCCGTHFPLRCVKGKHNPYFLYYGPNLWNGPNRISTNTRDWVCLTRGLMTRKVYHWHLATLKTLLHSTCISHHEVWGCGVFSLVFFRRQSQVSGREKFCTNAQSVCCNWASLKSMGGCGILLLTDWLIYPFIQAPLCPRLCATELGFRDDKDNISHTLLSACYVARVELNLAWISLFSSTTIP